MPPHQRPDAFGIGWAVQIQGKQLKTLSRPSRVVLIESDPIFHGSLCCGGPEVKQHRLSAQRRQSANLSREIGKRKIGRLDRRQQPSLNRGGQCFDFLWLRGGWPGIGGLNINKSASPRWRAEGLYFRWFRALFNPHSMIGVPAPARSANKSKRAPGLSPVPCQSRHPCCAAKGSSSQPAVTGSGGPVQFPA